MFEELIKQARRIRHVLDAWCALALCPVVAELPWGLPLGELWGLVGIGTAIRLKKDERPRHGRLVYLLFAGWMLVFPFTRPPGNSQRGIAVPPLQQHSEISNPIPQVTSFAATSGENSQFSTTTSLTRPSPPTHPPAPLREPVPITSVPESNSLTVPPSAAAVKPRRDLLEEAEAVVQGWWEARNYSQIEKAVSLHADQSSLGGPLLPREELRRRLVDDWQRNSSVRESNIVHFATSRSEETWIVDCHTRFSYPDKNRGIQTYGQCQHAFALSDERGVMRITRHTDAVLPLLSSDPSPVGRMKPTEMRKVTSSCLEADVAGDLDASMNLYERSVRYFGKTLTREQIRDDKERYFQRWPKRQELFEGDFKVATVSGNRVACNFRSKFSTVSEERGEWCEGHAQHHFVLTLSGNRPVIVEQSATILDSRKGTFPPKSP